MAGNLLKDLTICYIKKLKERFITILAFQDAGKFPARLFGRIRNYFYLCRRERVNIQIEEYNMLGVNSQREPITPEFSKKIREALWRATTGNLTTEEREMLRKEREASKKVRIIWK